MNTAEVEWEVELDFITLENLSYTRGRDGAKGNPPRARLSRCRPAGAHWHWQALTVIMTP